MKLQYHLLFITLSFLIVNSCHDSGLKKIKNVSSVSHFRPDSNKVIENIFLDLVAIRLLIKLIGML